MNPSRILSSLLASTMVARGPLVFAMDAAGKPDLPTDVLDQLRLIGIDFSNRDIARMMSGMDAQVLTPTNFPGSIAAVSQFLQVWLPGIVRTMTTARKIDRLVGVTVGGSWEDEEVIQTILEPTGLAVPYGDYTNVPLASWNPAYERRSIVRFEAGLKVGVLEEARAARASINSATEKRAAAAMALDLQRNRVGFYGYNGGVNRTYGFLNDPNLPAYVTVPNGAAASPLWSTKTFLEITADIRAALGALQTNSGDIIDPETTKIVLALPTTLGQYLTVTSTYGNSVRDWMKETYPNIRVETAPELVGANGGANVFYLYAEKVEDGSSDGGETFVQIVPAKMKTLGVDQQAKAYVEDYTNALAGVMVKRPFAVVRRSGI